MRGSFLQVVFLQEATVTLAAAIQQELNVYGRQLPISSVWQVGVQLDLHPARLE